MTDYSLVQQRCGYFRQGVGRHGNWSQQPHSGHHSMSSALQRIHFAVRLALRQTLQRTTGTAATGLCRLIIDPRAPCNAARAATKCFNLGQWWSHETRIFSWDVSWRGFSWFVPRLATGVLLFTTSNNLDLFFIHIVHFQLKNEDVSSCYLDLLKLPTNLAPRYSQGEPPSNYISVALEVDNCMRYINLLTYLLTYVLVHTQPLHKYTVNDHTNWPIICRICNFQQTASEIPSS